MRKNRYAMAAAFAAIALNATASAQLASQSASPPQPPESLASGAKWAGEMRHAVWSEVDLDKGVWRIPAEKMKGRIEHVVPLSQQAIELMLELRRFRRPGDYVFPSLQSRLRPTFAS